MTTTSHKRRADLRIKPTKTGGQHFVSFTASNGEPLGTGETHPTFENAAESDQAWERAMVEVLEDRGYTVTPPAQVPETTTPLVTLP